MAEGEARTPSREPAHGAGFADVPAFVRGLAFADLPADVVAQAQRCLRDLIGVGAAGRTTRLAGITSAYAATQLCARGEDARILFDGRRASVAGAAFAGAAMLDAFDAHDGHPLTKGHAGVAILPALLALIDAGFAPGMEGRELLTSLVIGYEIATRAGIAQHASVADYHCSGSWNALGCAAVASRLVGFDMERTRHALGVAEYFGPRGQMLRVTDHPTMLKDGSAWGAHAGVTAAMLARDGFTGAPSIVIEGDQVRGWWSDLGVRWRIHEQYFKAYPVCRWAQPAVEAALALQREHGFTADAIARIDIETFREAVTLGASCARPRNTEEAQYSITFPVAAALVFGTLGASEVDGPALDDPRALRLLSLISLVEDTDFARRFPAERVARMRIVLRDGRTLVSAPATARGNPENPLAEDELSAKYRALADPVLGPDRARRVEALVAALPHDSKASARLVDDLLAATRNTPQSK